jgi:hypothetical protein
MINPDDLASRQLREAKRLLDQYVRPARLPRLSSLALLVCLVALSISQTPRLQAKQQCGASVPADQHGQWWSYRLIDGRKCWYEGKPMLPKSMLEWPSGSWEQASSAAEPTFATEKSSNPLDAQAWVPEQTDTFEALWRTRVDGQFH